ncbi:MAG: C39 family peptidase, partial [Longicatena sp.]
QKITFGRDTAYFMGDDGSTQSGIIEIESNNYYFDPRIDNKMFFGVTVIEGEFYYFELNSGKMNTSGGWLTFGNSKYYAKDSGKLYHNQMITFGNDLAYYLGNDAKILTGEHIIDRRYYCFASDGKFMRMSANIPYYNQRDPKWGNDIYGDYYFAGTGCVPTAAAMIYSFLLDSVLTPRDMGYWAYKEGYFNTSGFGTTDQFLPAVSSFFNLPCQGNLNMFQAIDSLRHGKLLMASMNPPFFTSPGTTHGIVIYGIDENNMVSVYDPYYREHNQKYSIEMIFNHLSTDPFDCKAGGPIFAIG